MDTPGGSDWGRLLGVHVVPHRIDNEMKYRRAGDTSLAARVQLFVSGSAMPEKFNGKTPAELLGDGQWAWHDMDQTGGVYPDTMLVHVTNQTERDLLITGVRFWLPAGKQAWRELWPQDILPVTSTVRALDKGYVKLESLQLPLTYAAIEVITGAGSHIGLRGRTTVGAADFLGSAGRAAVLRQMNCGRRQCTRYPAGSRRCTGLT